jgi:SAM-dependent methyltransferase
MAPSELWDETDAATYDADVADMFDESVLGPTVDLLAELAAGGPALEFAVGTGRIALPLVERGIAVTGIELSPAMIHRLREKAGPERLPVTVGDMSATRLPDRFSLVYLAFNTLSNLTTQAEQVACFRNAAAHLIPGGHFVIDLWIPPLRKMPPGQTVVPSDVSDGHLGFDQYDTVDQICTSHHYVREQDGQIRHSSGRFRYVWPAECDLMARLAGLNLVARYQDYLRRPFTDTSEQHVSVYRRADESAVTRNEI